MTINDRSILLCVGDDEAGREFASVITTMLNEMAVCSRVVNSKAAALSVMDRENIDLVLLDFLGISWDGLAFIDEVVVRGISVIALCDRSKEEVAVNVMKQGAVDYLIKGEFTALQLSQSIRNAFEKATLKELLHHKQKELEDFAYVVSHDLNAPLFKIRQCCDLIVETCGNDIPERAATLLSIIKRGCEQMNSLINDLLDYSRVDRQRKVIDEVDLNGVVNDVLVLYKNTLDDRNVQMIVHDLPTMVTNRVAMRQLFQNLIGNAIKYNQSTSPRIVIAARLLNKEEHKFLELTVDDNGIGIEPKYYSKIFKPFERLHTQSEYPGSGLGLAICKKLVEQLGGKISVDKSSSEGGTQFVVSLPM
jgi:signal transduction histidine kinase